jgi:uncharacterized damage-inducible protein DinB
MDVSDPVCYNDAIRKLYFEAIAKLPWNEVVRSRGASFDTIRGIFLHLTLVEDRWISYTLVGRFSDWKDPDFDAFQDVESLKQYMQRVHGNTERYLQNLKPEDAQRLVTVPLGKTPDTKITVETALTHMAWSAWCTSANSQISCGKSMWNHPILRTGDTSTTKKPRAPSRNQVYFKKGDRVPRQSNNIPQIYAEQKISLRFLYIGDYRRKIATEPSPLLLLVHRKQIQVVLVD